MPPSAPSPPRGPAGSRPAGGGSPPRPGHSPPSRCRRTPSDALGADVGAGGIVAEGELLPDVQKQLGVAGAAEHEALTSIMAGTSSLGIAAEAHAQLALRHVQRLRHQPGLGGRGAPSTGGSGKSPECAPRGQRRRRPSRRASSTRCALRAGRSRTAPAGRRTIIRWRCRAWSFGTVDLRQSPASITQSG